MPTLDRVTVYAGLAALFFIVAGYKLLRALSGVLDPSTIEPLQQAMLLVAVPVFQLSRNLFVKPAQRSSVTERHWSHNVYSAAFIFAFSLVGLSNVIGFLAGAASGMSAANLLNSGVQGNGTIFLNTIYSAISLWLIAPLIFCLCLVFGWINHRKQLERPWRFFLASYVMLIVSLGIEYLLTIRDPGNLAILQMSSESLALYKLVVFPPIYTLLMMLGYASRLVYRFFADRIGYGAAAA
jgi:cytochrome bd-type quinol oxidase subunit 2